MPKSVVIFSNPVLIAKNAEVILCNQAIFLPDEIEFRFLNCDLKIKPEPTGKFIQRLRERSISHSEAPVFAPSSSMETHDFFSFGSPRVQNRRNRENVAPALATDEATAPTVRNGPVRR